MNKYKWFSREAQKLRKKNKMCEDKVAFETEEEAFQKGQKTYKCNYCGKWHRSSKFAMFVNQLHWKAQKTNVNVRHIWQHPLHYILCKVNTEELEGIISILGKEKAEQLYEYLGSRKISPATLHKYIHDREICEALKSGKISFSELAKRLGVSRMTIYRMYHKYIKTL